jgi:dienelactone hydrolase
VKFSGRVLGIVTIAFCSYALQLLSQTSGNAPTHFAYDASAPLDVKQLSEEKRGGVTIDQITYASPGGVVSATLVIPVGPGKFAAVIWGHWLMPGAANANRTEFLEEAVALAPSRVVSLLIDAPQARQGYKLGPNPALVEEQVIDLRRGADLLLARPDVDATRLAYVGHSWDAGNGAILDALDKRFAAFVFMSGLQSTLEYMVSSDSPQVEQSRKVADMAKVEAALKANAWADPATYAGQLGPAPALFQYGLHDEDWVPLQDAKDYVAMSSGPKEVKYYDSGHPLNFEAKIDRDAFLKRNLKVDQ